jgi:peptidoglycan/LPS O-acetylase OafA/YrhL
MRYLGKVSYPLYLLHWPIMAALIVYTDLKQSLPLYAATVVALSVLTAALVHWAFEEPVRRAIVRRGRQSDAIPSTPAAVITSSA